MEKERYIFSYSHSEDSYRIEAFEEHIKDNVSFYLDGASNDFVTLFVGLKEECSKFASDLIAKRISILDKNKHM